MHRSISHQVQVVLFVTLLALSAETAWTQAGKSGQRKQLEIGGQPVATVLAKLGAKMEEGVSLKQIESYSRQFGFGDSNRDGKHSKTEYVDNGNYLTPMARRGIFNASDVDQDGFVSRDEYVLNRIITDEAKMIVQKMDANRDGQIRREEFVSRAMDDKELAAQVFDALDTNRDGLVFTPEYLRVWGRWARTNRGNAESRLAKRRNELVNPGFASVVMKQDKNGDGKIDAGEWQQLLKNADRNGDGMLEKSELDLMFKKTAGTKR